MPRRYWDCHFWKQIIVDVIARISRFGPIQAIHHGDRMARVLNMYLTNESNFTLDVSLWEQFIEVFDPIVLAKESKAFPVVVACSSIAAKSLSRKIWIEYLQWIPILA